MVIAVVGASGFVGAMVADSVSELGHRVVSVRAPRFTRSTAECVSDRAPSGLPELALKLAGVEAVIICSGNPDASEKDADVLLAANAASPAAVARAASAAGVKRLVYVSSAAVQGRRPTLDESDSTEEFSSYAHSKAEGERRVRHEFGGAVIYRPPSVHAESRRVTLMTAKLAGSPFSSVAAPGDQPTPQALIGNVASAIAFLAITDVSPPPVVIHPWEGLSSADLMELMGGKRPVVLPRGLASAVCRAMEVVGTRVAWVAANARRVEMLWFGQEQATSWLTTAGWEPPLGEDAWRELGETIRKQKA